ncbi:MAG: hypothetical protein LAT53_04580 [Idiomarina sp.]|nr:hypothetical protein [Idiomarina sp.]
MERQLSVSFSFLKIYMNLSEQPPSRHPDEASDKDKINHFISAFLSHGLGDTQHFPGRLKESTDVDKDDLQKFSESYIKLVDLNSHPPFVLPTIQDFEGDASIPMLKLRLIK